MKRKALSAILALTMLLSLCMPTALAAKGEEAYGAVVTLQNKDDGLEVVVTVNDDPRTPYKVYVFDSDPTGEFVRDTAVTGLGDIMDLGGTQDDFTNATEMYAVAIVNVTVANQNGTISGKADVAGLAASKTYWIVAWTQGQSTGVTSEAKLNADGKVEVPQSSLIFDLQGGKSGGSEGNVTVQVNASEEITLASVSGAPTPTKENFIFNGWALSQGQSNSGQAVEKVSSASENSSVTVYAIWTAKATPNTPSAESTVYRDGMTLDDITLTGGTGSWAWTAPTTSVSVSNSGSSYEATATETETTASGIANIRVTITQGSVTVNDLPDSISVYSGQSINDVASSYVDALTTATDENNSAKTDLEGAFSFTTNGSITNLDDDITTAGTVSYQFEPTDSTNYETATGVLNVIVGEKPAGSDSAIIFTDPTLEYDGTAQAAAIENAISFDEAVDGDGPLTVDLSFQFKDSNKNDIADAAVKAVGSYSVVVTGETANKRYEKTIDFTIDRADLTGWDTGSITGVSATKTYDGDGDGADLTISGNATLTGVNGETFTLEPKNSQTVDYKTAANYDVGIDYSYDVTLDNFTVTSNTGAVESNYNMPSTALTYSNGAITEAAQDTLVLTGTSTTATYGDEAWTLGTTGGSGDGAVSYSLTAGDGDIASITGNKLTILKSGNFTVKATKAADGNYTAVDSALVTCTVNKKELSLAKTTLSGKVSDGATGIDLSQQGLVTDPEGLKTLADAVATLSYSIQNAGDTGASISQNNLTWNAAGTATFGVTMTGNSYYTLASPSTVTLNVTAKTPLNGGFTNTEKTYGSVTAPTYTPGAGQESVSYELQYEVGAGQWSTAVPSGAGEYKVKAVATEGSAADYGESSEATFKINPKPIGVSGTVTKTYDGDNTKAGATGTLTADGNINGETIEITSYTGSFNAETVSGANKFTVDTIDFTVTGTNTEKGNYVLKTTDGANEVTGEITAKEVDLTTACLTITKAYDGDDKLTSDNKSALEGSLESYNVLSADASDVKLDVSKISYSDKDYHTAANVKVSGTLGLVGDKAGNYTLTYEAGDITGAITRVTGLTAQLNATASISGTSVKLSDLVAMTGMVNNENADALVGSDWTYADGVYKNTDGTIKATFYVKTGADTYEAATGALEAGKTYYVDVLLTGDDYGNYTVTTGLTGQGAAPGSDDAVTGKYCVVTIASGGGGGVVPPVEKPQHHKYMQGYPGGSFLPDGNLTRAEAATMMARLSEGFNEDTAYACDFNDVPAGEWYANYVGFAASKGLVKGYEDGSFRGDNTITRGEFAAMISRFVGLAPATDMTGYPFIDGEGHWAQGCILALYKAGMISGYEDDSVRPDAMISRAEAAKLVNAALGRVPTPELVDKAITEAVYSDVAQGTWYYYDVMEASITHDISDYHK